MHPCGMFSMVPGQSPHCGGCGHVRDAAEREALLPPSLAFWRQLAGREHPGGEVQEPWLGVREIQAGGEGLCPLSPSAPPWVVLEHGVHAPSLALVLGRGIAGSAGCRPLLERQPTVRKRSTQHGPLLPVGAERGQLVYRWKPQVWAPEGTAGTEGTGDGAGATQQAVSLWPGLGGRLPCQKGPVAAPLAPLQGCSWFRPLNCMLQGSHSPGQDCPTSPEPSTRNAAAPCQPDRAGAETLGPQGAGPPGPPFSHLGFQPDHP